MSAKSYIKQLAKKEGIATKDLNKYTKMALKHYKEGVANAK